MAAGAAAVLDWSIALTSAALFGFLVEIGGHVGNKPKKRTSGQARVEQPIDEFAVLQFRIADLEEDDFTEDDVAA